MCDIWLMPAIEPCRFVIVIPHYKGADLLRATLSAVLLATKPFDAVVVVDNGSLDGSGAVLADEFADVRWLRNDRNKGFAAACNQGAALMQSRFVLFLNSDAMVPPDLLDRLAEFFEQTPLAGEVGCHLVGLDGRAQRGTSVTPDLLSESGLRKRVRRGFRDPTRAARVEAVVGACVALPRFVFERIGGWDEGFFFYEEDIDLSVRVRHAGFEVWYLPDLKVVHGRGASTREVRLPAQLEAMRSRFYYIRKHFPRSVACALWVARFLSLCLGVVGATFGTVATLGLHRGIRLRATRSLVALLWILLLMRPRWSLSGRA